MKHSKLILIFLTLLAVTGSMMSCENATFIDPKDLEPKISVTPLESPFGSAAGGVLSGSQQFCIDQVEGFIPQPKTQTNFQISVQSYNINQEFTFEVFFPEDLDFGDIRTLISSPLSGAGRKYTSDNGHGPGGILTAGVAAWSPGIGETAAVNRSFLFKFVVKDAEGHSAYTEQRIMVIPVFCLS